MIACARHLNPKNGLGILLLGGLGIQVTPSKGTTPHAVSWQLLAEVDVGTISHSLDGHQMSCCSHNTR